MNWFEKWLLRRIMRKHIRNSYSKYFNVEELYLEINEAVIEQFSDDSIPTHESFMKECFEVSLKASINNLKNK